MTQPAVAVVVIDKRNAPGAHPAGVGEWELWLERDPSTRARTPGHTAYEAFTNARAVLGAMSFCEVKCKLVADNTALVSAYLLPRAEKRA